MAIKSDRWIRRMAAQGMIQPFEHTQVREGDHGRLISYGTSSYGYDVRCADEFKIFTNINSAIVDPKNFDSNSFVDLKSDVCIIPPNSFALARTVEYFRIPRNVLTICLGKCLAADTRVVDAESGAYLPIVDLAFGRKTLGMRDWRLQPVGVGAFLSQGTKPLYELTTDAGLKIRATANHPFRQLQGWTQLGDLRPGDRIAVAGEIPVFGRTALPDREATLLGLMMSDELRERFGQGATDSVGDPVLSDLLGACMRACDVVDGTGCGCDAGDSLNRADEGSEPGQGHRDQWLTRYGLQVTAAQESVPQAIFRSPEKTTRLFLCALFSINGHLARSHEGPCVECSSKSRRLIEDIHHLLLRFGVFSSIREDRMAGRGDLYRLQIADGEQLERFARRIGFWPGSMVQRRLEREIPHAFLDLPASSCRCLSQPASALVEGAVAPRVSGPITHGPVWDVVARIEPAGEEEVFDLTVPGVHNFVANDMIVHNSTYARCGIIVNVTPLEPEWEGHVTLEFSNTTPLPAKIYANEGVAQILFLESDEVCETSYKDRGGKYQGQRGVTLPKS